MSRLLLVICLFTFCLSAWAQEREVKRSSDVVVIKGKSYYLHVVEQGQTLFSICKAYGVSLEEVKRLNQKSDNNLSIFDVLKIPYSEPHAEQDNNYYYYKVQKGETLYALSRKFAIKIKTILRDNPMYEKTPLGIGDIVKLPLREITMPRESGEQMAVEKPESQSFSETRTMLLHEDAENTVAADTNRMPLYTSGQSVEEDTSFHFDVNTVVPDNKYVKVALLLPFFARENMILENSEPDSLSDRNSRQLLHKSEQFVYFYEGFLLALDSLKKEGYKIELYPFDTEKNTEKVLAITEKINELNPDLIVGPVYGSELRMIAVNLTNRSIPLVYPLSSRSEDFAQYSNFLQVNPSFQVLAREMVEWLRSQENINPIVINPVEGEIIDEWSFNEAAREKKIFTDQLRQLPDINFYKWNFQEDQLEIFKQNLDLYKENVIILPTVKEVDISKILPVLSALADGYRITVVGLPDWQNFTSVDHETFYKLNVKLLSYSYIDPGKEQTQEFAETYRQYFYTEPHTLTNKAYDLALYFIPLVAKYGERSLEAIRYYNKNGLFSRFYFMKVCNACGLENRGLFIVNYGSDYQLHIEPLKY